MIDEMEYVPFSVRMEALAGRADSADLNAYMERRFEAAWRAYSEQELQRLSTLSCGGEQADEAKRMCLSAALAAWEAFHNGQQEIKVSTEMIDPATVKMLKRFQRRA